ncbi:hypothetical protein HELRODRAFT_161888 [Helobdella robusta]|uniref:Cytochrome c oxidase copper chaperone n=1 Tax=Helobdella robusta TaxID=6412 RepID=T1ES02_HELRO|nr:hypothetical protein HELRODRAFT_161888 [Helobdella robusta]ESO02598.1 hypothetical protein HELRODRAFT_161888 [Helobdella robusta]
MADESTGMFQKFRNMLKRSTIYADEPKKDATGDATKKDEAGGKDCKPCKICTEQRKAKEKCVKEKGEDKCKDLIKAFDECMKKNSEKNGKNGSKNGSKNGKH